MKSSMKDFSKRSVTSSDPDSHESPLPIDVSDCFSNNDLLIYYFKFRSWTASPILKPSCLLWMKLPTLQQVIYKFEWSNGNFADDCVSPKKDNVDHAETSVKKRRSETTDGLVRTFLLQLLGSQMRLQNEHANNILYRRIWKVSSSDSFQLVILKI